MGLNAKRPKARPAQFLPGMEAVPRIPPSSADPMESEASGGQDLFALELSYRSQGFVRIAGLDEAGLGPLAGPVVAASVILPPGVRIEGAADSKTLRPRLRVELDREIHRCALAVGIGISTVDEIDRHNIYKAGLLAMRRALEDLRSAPDLVLVDARTLPDLPWPQAAFIRGDARVHSIACASIVAKVLRDRMMAEYDQSFPEYGFSRHKGYGTAAHLAALERHGPCAIHRRTFRPLAGQPGLFGPAPAAGDQPPSRPASLSR